MNPQRKRLVTSESPPEMTLCPSRKAWLPYLLISIGLTAGCAWALTRTDDWRGWLGAIFFGLCTLVSGLMVVFPQVSRLRLTRDGFYLQTPFRVQFIPWDHVLGFGVTSMSGNAMVTFNYSAVYQGQKLGRQLAYDLSGSEGALPDTYGMSAFDLAELMNDWKRRHDAK